MGRPSACNFLHLNGVIQVGYTAAAQRTLPGLLALGLPWPSATRFWQTPFCVNPMCPTAGPHTTQHALASPQATLPSPSTPRRSSTPGTALSQSPGPARARWAEGSVRGAAKAACTDPAQQLSAFHRVCTVSAAAAVPAAQPQRACHCKQFPHRVPCFLTVAGRPHRPACAAG